MILRLAISVEHRLGRQTDRQTHNDGICIYRASMVLCCKNGTLRYDTPSRTLLAYSGSSRHGRLSLRVQSLNQLCQLRPVVRSLSMSATKTLVQAFHLVSPGLL